MIFAFDNRIHYNRTDDFHLEASFASYYKNVSTRKNYNNNYNKYNNNNYTKKNKYNNKYNNNYNKYNNNNYTKKNT